MNSLSLFLVLVSLFYSSTSGDKRYSQNSSLFPTQKLDNNIKLNGVISSNDKKIEREEERPAIPNGSAPLLKFTSLKKVESDVLPSFGVRSVNALTNTPETTNREVLLSNTVLATGMVIVESNKFHRGVTVIEP